MSFVRGVFTGRRACDTEGMQSLLTTVQVAEQLGVTRKTIERLVHRGKLEPIAQAPGRNGARFFTPETVETYRRLHPLTAVELPGLEAVEPEPTP